MEGFAMPEEVTTEAIKAALETDRSSLVPVEVSLAGLEMSTAYARLCKQERALAQARERLDSVQSSLSAARRASSHQDQAHRAVRRVAGELVDERLAQLEPLLIELYERLRPNVQWSTVGYKIRGDVKRFMRLTVGEGELNPRFCSAVVNGEHLVLPFYFRSIWLPLGAGGIRSFWTIQCSTLTTTERSI